jgi:hypothetical protein
MSSCSQRFNNFFPTIRTVLRSIMRRNRNCQLPIFNPKYSNQWRKVDQATSEIDLARCRFLTIPLTFKSMRQGRSLRQHTTTSLEWMTQYATRLQYS